MWQPVSGCAGTAGQSADARRTRTTPGGRKLPRSSLGATTNEDADEVRNGQAGHSGGSTSGTETAGDGAAGQGGNATPTRRARIIWASEIEPEPVEWAWELDGEGRIPSGSLSIAAGREGTGKSSFGIWLTARITRGTLPGAFYGAPRNVLYVAIEDSWRFTLVPRLIAAGADLSRVGRFDVLVDEGTEVTLSLPYDNDLLKAEISRHAGDRAAIAKAIEKQVAAVAKVHGEASARLSDAGARTREHAIAYGAKVYTQWEAQQQAAEHLRVLRILRSMCVEAGLLDPEPMGVMDPNGSGAFVGR